jgi:hypothetical protein
MRLSNPLDVCTSELRPYVEQFGGKFGPLEALRDRGGFRDHLLSTVYLRNGDQYRGDGSITDPLVRPTHPIDIHDLVGVQETLRAKDDTNASVNAAADRIRKQTAEPDVVQFADYSSIPGMYDPKDVLLGVQQRIPGVRASVLSHPNRPENDPEYVISWFRDRGETDDKLASGVEIFSATFNLRGRMRRLLGNTYSGEQQPNMLPQKLITLYERVRATKLMHPDRSFVMEAVGDETNPQRDPIICQLRDFKERALADWRIDKESLGMDLPDLVFGVTPKEGKRLTIVHSPDGFGEDGVTPLSSLGKPWGLLRTRHQQELSLQFQPKDDMYAYFAGFRFGSGMPGILHNQERVAGLAEVTVFEKIGDRAYDLPGYADDYDFSRRLVAEMSGHTLDTVRQITGRYALATNTYRFMLDSMLDDARGKIFDVILRCDGYTATLDVAPGQKSTALRKEE